MRGIFFTADDLGISREANEAMLHAHLHGALNGAALMLGQNATDHGVELARQTPGLQVGFHLHLCDSRPLTLGGGAAHVDWPWGSDPAWAGWAIGTQRSARALAEAEIVRQWQEFRSTGLRCAFVNAHHHLHVHPFVMERLREIVGPECGDAWWRWGRPRWFGRSRGIFSCLSRTMASLGWAAVRSMSQPPEGTGSPRTLWGIDRGFRMDAEETIAALQTLAREDAKSSVPISRQPNLTNSDPAPHHEFLFHPRYISMDDKDLQALLILRQSMDVRFCCTR